MDRRDDAARPPVLAHQRFEAERHGFSGLDLAARFERIHRINLWGAAGAVWLLTTTFPGWNTNRDCEDGDWRALNLQRAPFSWPAPAALINERCDEGNGGWSDKSLGLWRLADLTPPG